MKAPRDTKNLNKGQFIGTYGPKLRIRKNTKIDGTKDAIKLVRAIADQEQEYMVVVSRRQDGTATNARIVSIGSRIGSEYSTSNVFKGAIIDGAGGIIVVHNHPGGDLMPTKADKKMLRNLIKAGKILDILILDSVIIHGKAWRSMLPDVVI
jgi:DNA repair protein RadC